MIEEEFAMSKFASKADRDDALISEIARLRAEVMHLRMYAPGQRQEHKIRMAPSVGPLNAKFWGLEAAEDDFDAT